MNEIVERAETLLPGPALALGALLGVTLPDLEDGASLPLLWHWVYLLDRPAQVDLGPDGHPVRGTVPAPPAPGRRRMWAGGQVRMTGLLRCDLAEPTTRRSHVESVEEKQGRSGHLTFVSVRHQVLQRGSVVVDERQDIVYREAASSGQPAAASGESPAVPPSDGEWAIDVSPTLLFRFSALTYNAHRIHYDRPYARDVEGYPGLLTHGPLQALTMAEAARARGWHDGASSFEYRLLSPLFDHQGLIASAIKDKDAVHTAVRDFHGRKTATGTLRRIA
ncbi:MAG: mesaconyl-C4 CoA hydratase [Trebonia sp.]